MLMIGTNLSNIKTKGNLIYFKKKQIEKKNKRVNKKVQERKRNYLRNKVLTLSSIKILIILTQFKIIIDWHDFFYSSLNNN